MPVCIYCKINKKSFNKREHVIPQAFGRFQPKNFILNDRKKKDKKVCDDCNAKFGRELEEYLAKDSYEGYVLKTKYSNKNPKKERRHRIVLRIAECLNDHVYRLSITLLSFIVAFDHEHIAKQIVIQRFSLDIVELKCILHIFCLDY
jgi:hypothetical protein